METAFYIGTAILTIAWSVWTYLTWSDRSRLEDYTGKRFYLIASPSGYFLLLALAGWQRVQVIRLDLIGLALYDCLIVLCWIILLIARGLRAVQFKKAYIRLLVFFNIVSVILVTGVFLIRLFPPLLIRVSDFINQGVRLDFFKFAWVGLDPETHERDFVSMANKILIALFSYIPITVLRTLYTHRQISRQRKWITTEISALKRKIEELEKKLRE
ncbi:MAG: hypothetical protein JSV89_17855 [Spirochaetaceae bacterium]|nr:MAG: hypothetical protein JSV89_17855 [Spirochaetaceae bacterium]